MTRTAARWLERGALWLPPLGFAVVVGECIRLALAGRAYASAAWLLGGCSALLAAGIVLQRYRQAAAWVRARVHGRRLRKALAADRDDSEWKLSR